MCLFKVEPLISLGGAPDAQAIRHHSGRELELVAVLVAFRETLLGSEQLPTPRFHFLLLLRIARDQDRITNRHLIERELGGLATTLARNRGDARFDNESHDSNS